MTSETRCSLVIPVYKNAETIDALLEAITVLYARLDRSLEAVFVVDGSPDASYALLKAKLPQAGFPSQLICLSRNFGSFAAIRMGLSVGRGPCFGVMAADLQEPPELIEQFFKTLRNEPVDVVIGTRASRDDPFLSTLSANLFWGIYSRFVQREMPRGGVDVFGCNVEVRDALLRLNERHSSLVGLLLWVGFRRKVVFYSRLKRSEGKSAWTFNRKLRYMMDSIFSFTDLPIVALLFVGMVGFGTATAVSALVLLAWLMGWIGVPGYTPVMLSIMASTSLILVALGIIGSYVWRTFENTKQRPLYVPMSREEFGNLGAERQAP
jgi:glycosyltransferase involved in cell wall biosynthesis